MSDLFTDAARNSAPSIDIKSAEEIDESRWYVIKEIDRLYNAKKVTSIQNIREVVFKKVDKKRLWSKVFYLGPNTSLEDFVNMMYGIGILEQVPLDVIPGKESVQAYRLTQNGKKALEYFVKKMKIFK